MGDYDAINKEEDVCKVRHYYGLPCKDCIYHKTNDCIERRRIKKNGNSKEKSGRDYTELQG